MSATTATVRQLRTDIRSVKREIEQHGQVVITDRGQPAYLIKPLPQKPRKSAGLPDSYARLVKRQPQPLSPKETHRFWEEEHR
jgi:antitoxin (DNA-binding transcriptional repressor) of toxin-antitoxin stability system